METGAVHDARPPRTIHRSDPIGHHQVAAVSPSPTLQLFVRVHRATPSSWPASPPYFRQCARGRARDRPLLLPHAHRRRNQKRMAPPAECTKCANDVSSDLLLCHRIAVR